MLKTLGFCATVVASMFHRESPIPRLQATIDRAFTEDASLQDYMQAAIALNHLEIEIQKLREAKDIATLDALSAWANRWQGDGFIQNRLRGAIK